MTKTAKIVLLCVALLLGCAPALRANNMGAAARIKARSAAPAQGLVYISKSNTAPALSDYHQWSPKAGGSHLDADCNIEARTYDDEYLQGIQSLKVGGNGLFVYAWAKPARGYYVQTGLYTDQKGKQYSLAWSNYQTGFSSENTCPYKQTGGGDIYAWVQGTKGINDGPALWDGVADVMYVDAGGGTWTYRTVTAIWSTLPGYAVNYYPATGGSYSVHYAYDKTRQRADEEYEFEHLTEDYTVDATSGIVQPNGHESPAKVVSYSSDTILLSSTASNWLGWYENDSCINSTTPQGFQYIPSRDAVVTAHFKYCHVGNPNGSEIDEGQVNLKLSFPSTTSESGTIVIPITDTVGQWVASDFIVTPTLIDGEDALIVGTPTYDPATSLLSIPYTYSPREYGCTDMEVQVDPTYGNVLTFHVLASAYEAYGYEARIINGTTEYATGSLSDMLAQANTMNNNPTLQLARDVSISTPLSFRRSMTFDLNGKKLEVQGTSAYSIDQTGIDVRVEDGSCSKTGVVAVQASTADTASVATFTAMAKLSLLGGKLSVTNSVGPAYGIRVSHGSVYFQQGGNLTVQSPTEARGTHVVGDKDYATITGGIIHVSAPAKAYGIWSAGQANISSSDMKVSTSGAEAYGVYVGSGTTTCDSVSTTVEAQTKAYGAYVAAGRLNCTGGSFSVTDSLSDAYGVFIANGATANLQQRTLIDAVVTDGGGVRGIQNQGTVAIKNIIIDATAATTDAVAINTQNSALSTKVEDGTYTATSTQGTVYGLHHQQGALTVSGGTFQGTATSGNQAYGARLTAAGTIKNSYLLGETQDTGRTAYGLVAATKGTKVALTNCSVRGRSATSLAYAIYSRANLTATDCQLFAQTQGGNNAYGLYSEAGTDSLTNCTAEVYSYAAGAYGINQTAGTVNVSGGRYVVTAAQSSATAAQNSELYGVKNSTSSTTNLSDASFIVSAPDNTHSQYGYGMYIQGKLNSTNCADSLNVRTRAYGIYGKGSSSNLNLKNNKVFVRTTGAAYSYGVYAEKKFAIDQDIVTARSYSTAAYALWFTSGAQGTVPSGKFFGYGNGTTDYGAINNAASAAYVKLTGGVYNSNNNLKKYPATGYSVFALDDTQPDYAGGYRYTIATENPSRYVCRIVGGNRYATLEEAMEYAQNHPTEQCTILMTQQYTLPTGDYTLPANAYLLVPYKDTQIQGAAASPTRTHTSLQKEEFLCLTLANGANLSVNGKIEVGGEMYCQQTNLTGYTAGGYGRLQMDEGSHIDLNSGAQLYAWGFVTGKGTIRVKNNAEVHEMFQLGDMKSVSDLVTHYVGTDISGKSANKAKFFPVTQYFIQNVEVPTTYYYNARMTGAMGMEYTGSFGQCDTVHLVGTHDAFFQVTDDDESSWVRKYYDAEHDMQVWEVNSATQIGSISMTFNNPVVSLQAFASSITINSAYYNLPLASNMLIHVMDGNCDITQGTELLPGASFEVNKTASLTVLPKQCFFILDTTEWKKSYYSKATISFSPSWPNGKKPTRSYNPAAVNIHGSVHALGEFITTKSGANIYSSNEDAGTVRFDSVAPTSATHLQYISSMSGSIFNGDNKYVCTDIPDTTALLRNGDGSYTATAGTPAGMAYAYLNDRWHLTYVNGPFFIIDDTVYAKPAEYVALQRQQKDSLGLWEGVPETDHTYRTRDGQILILLGSDTITDPYQWWRVYATETAGVFECKKDGYEGFYHYNDSTGTWELVQVKVTFYAAETNNHVLKVITTNYHAIPDQAVIAENPTKQQTDAYTYTFYGWKSSVTGKTYKWTDTLEVALTDMSYRPVFTQQKRKYTITYLDANNGDSASVETEYGTMPTYPAWKASTPQAAYKFRGWSPTIVPVLSNATYTALWDTITNKYTITWMDGDSLLERDRNLLYGSATSYDGILPSRETDDRYVYQFDGWQSNRTDSVYANGQTPAVDTTTVYTAHYALTPRYQISFINYDGTILQQTPVTEGETPAYSSIPRRTPDRDGYFRFTGWKNSEDYFFPVGSALPAATQDETYTSQWEYVETVYTIFFVNYDGKNSAWSDRFGKGEIPSYGGMDPLGKDTTADSIFVLNHWVAASDGLSYTDPLPKVDSTETYTAVFRSIPRNYIITVNANTKDAILTGAGEYEYNTSVQISAQSTDNCHKFQSWSDGVTDNPRTLEVTENATYTAIFQQIQYNISVQSDDTTKGSAKVAKEGN